jgi:hypothetical protein
MSNKKQAIKAGSPEKRIMNVVKNFSFFEKKQREKWKEKLLFNSCAISLILFRVYFNEILCVSCREISPTNFGNEEKS